MERCIEKGLALVGALAIAYIGVKKVVEKIAYDTAELICDRAACKLDECYDDIVDDIAYTTARYATELADDDCDSYGVCDDDDCEPLCDECRGRCFCCNYYDNCDDCDDCDDDFDYESAYETPTEEAAPKEKPAKNGKHNSK